MDRYVIMVDAGYLMHKGVEIVSRKISTSRRDLTLTNPAALIQLLIIQSRAALGISPAKELLRVYWYDGVMAGGHTREQRAICELPDVNFRAGIVNFKGQQKGVDSLIVTDLFELASNHAVTDAVLVTGDSDLAIGIELAQKKGVRIAVLGVEDLAVGVGSSQSREITDRADRVGRFGAAELTPVMRYLPKPLLAPSVPTVAARTVVLSGPEKVAIEGAVQAFIAANSPSPSVIDASTKRIETLMDRALIFHVFTALGHGKLNQPEKIHARACFRAQLGCP